MTRENLEGNITEMWRSPQEVYQDLKRKVRSYIELRFLDEGMELKAYITALCEEISVLEERIENLENPSKGP